MDWDEMSNLYRRPSIDASYQVWFFGQAVSDVLTRGSVGEPASLTCHFVLRKLYSEPSIGVSYQNSINLAK